MEVYMANFHDQVAWDKLKEYKIKLLCEVYPHADFLVRGLPVETLHTPGDFGIQ